VQNLVIGVSGRTGAGKSVWTRNYIGKIASAHPRRSIVLYDPEEEMIEISQDSIEPYSLREFLNDHPHADTDQPRFIIDVIPNPRSVEKGANVAARAIFRYENVTAVFEEMANYTKPQVKDDDISDLFRRGRKRGIDILWTTQSISEVSIPARRATGIWVLFRHTETRDIDALCDRVGDEIADKIAKLQRFEFIIYDVMDEREITEEELISGQRSEPRTRIESEAEKRRRESSRNRDRGDGEGTPETEE
jgi:ribosomal 50S subunit-associated protein YjgA (DUF615 family)